MIFADANAIISSFSSLLNVILLVTAVSLGALNIRNKYEKGKDSETVQTLKDSNDAFATRREADKIVIAARDAEILVLKQKAEILESHVTQAPDITKLMTQLTKQHKETTESNRHIIEGLGQVAQELGGLAKAMNKDSNG